MECIQGSGSLEMVGRDMGEAMKLRLPSLYLHVAPVAPKLWITMHGFQFLADDRECWIPEMFICDKYSVPVGLVFKRSRKHEVENIPAILHDYLVRNRRLLGFSLMQCHDLFLQAMKVCGIGRATRWAKYSAVVTFNWTMAGKGDGTPNRQVKAFIDKHGYGC
jgi:hypothetical protein